MNSASTVKLKFLKMKTLIILFSLIIFSSCGTTSLEDRISEMLQDPEVKTYFEDAQMIVIISNDVCNETTVDFSKIVAEKDVKLFSREDAYMRLIDKTMEVVEQEDPPNGKLKYELK
ncbi:MAG: hypothetical protein DWQ02_22325 [Bacteroidetes bacterium]|nr:MAG: hypothetical protein DWQ02_22325 [Bacteroidota bacterium]